jgi:hypothetical protein
MPTRPRADQEQRHPRAAEQHEQRHAEQQQHTETEPDHGRHQLKPSIVVAKGRGQFDEMGGA